MPTKITWETTSVFSHTISDEDLTGTHDPDDGEDEMALDSLLADLEGRNDTFDYVAERAVVVREQVGEVTR